MITVPYGSRVWLATGETDMRKGLNGLALQVQERSSAIRTPAISSFSVGAATPCSRFSGTTAWDVALCEAARARPLHLASPADGSVVISPAQLGYLLDAIDWRNPRWTYRPRAAG